MTHRPFAAALWMAGSITSFIAMAIAGRSVAGTHDTFEIMTWRSLIGFFLVLLAAVATGQSSRISARRLPEHLVRNIFHFSGQNLWFWALTMIPLAQVFALEFTSPVWVILLSPLVLGERITRARAAAAALGFLGVLIVARPDPAQISPGILAAAGCAIGFAVSVLMTRAMTRKGESVVSILFWLTLMQFVMGLGMALIDGHMALPTVATLPWLVLIGFAGGRPPALPLNHALVKNISIHGFNWGAYRTLDPAALRDSLAALSDLYAQGRLRPVAGTVLPLDRAVEGYDLLRRRQAVGKVILTMTGASDQP